jgi:PTH2 family peptidyl-tRNA hydrolase
MGNEIKQMICMRTDLGMRKGKMIAQGAHAAMAFLTNRIRQCADGVRTVEQFQRYGDFDLWGFFNISEVMKKWVHGSFAKVCVRVNSLEELMEIKEKAEEADLEVHLITDSGKTEFHGEPTPTCLAIGPDYSEKIDPITGDLKLL